MPAYDRTRFDPPAPVALASLRNPSTGAALDNVAMLIDSGADVTLVPSAVGDALGLPETPGQYYELVSFDGSRSFAAVAQWALVFGRRTFRGQFLLADQSWGILGRNVLNAPWLVPDGPRLTWDEQAPTRRSL